jgi:hypothetical protein
MTLTKIDRSMTGTGPWGVTKTVDEWMKAHEMDEIYARFGDWVVSSYCLECLVLPYAIPASRLAENWESHMLQKRWVDLHSFCQAIESARKYHAARGRRS